MYTLQTTPLYNWQVEQLSPKATALLVKKIELLKENPFRFKPLSQYRFRIRFSDRRKQKRLVYSVHGDTIILECILDRDKDYRELQ